MKSKAKAKSSPQATVAQAPDSQIESAGKDIYKAGDFNAKRLAYVKEKRKEGLSGQEAQTAWMHSDERADLVAANFAETSLESRGIWVIWGYGAAAAIRSRYSFAWLVAFGVRVLQPRFVPDILL